ncbi:MAG: DsbA family protein [Actinobacteria bacterium]|nr:DsbA family protein [Actinomycetota bacterium]
MSKTSKNTPASSPGSRREALRTQQQARARAAARTGRAVKAAWIAGLTVIALMVGVIAWTLVRAGGPTAGISDSLTVPAGATSGGAVVVGQASAPVTVSVYADFMCPWCGRFERANGDALASAVEAGTAKLEIHPMAFLDEMSAGTRYSSRAANAFVTLANDDPAVAFRFHRLLYANQPAENSAGLSDARLAELAQEAGATPAMTDRFAAQTYAGWVEDATQQAWDDGVTGTPTVKINGQTFTGDLFTAGPLAAAIEAAARG